MPPSCRSSLALTALFGFLITAPAVSANEFVRMELNLFNRQENFQNTVFIELFDDRPLTRDNFLRYVDGDHYDNTIFHRLVQGFVLQGGGFYESYDQEPSPIFFSLSTDQKVDLDGDPSTPNPSVNNEFSNSPPRSNVAGTLSMAKTAAGPDSATNQFFFNLGNNSANLDNQNGGFTVFAQVAGNGMSLINSLTHPTLGLSRDNLNPDELIEINGQAQAYGQDGDRDSSQYAGPFTTVPRLANTILKIEEASRISYFNSLITVPAEGLNLTTQDAFFDTGTQSIGPGIFRVGAGRSLGIADGVVIGSLVEVNGTMAPGLQVGSARVAIYWQRASGKLELQLGGVTAGDEYDQLLVTAQAELDGELEVRMVGGFSPMVGDTFNIFSASSITGAFSDIDLPTLRDGMFWQMETTSTAITLTAAGGDYNMDGVVDAADYTVWRENIGATTALAADGDGNGSIDADDYAVWRANYGKINAFYTTPPAATASPAPEPTACLLAFMAVVTIVSQRGRRNR